MPPLPNTFKRSLAATAASAALLLGAGQAMAEMTKTIAYIPENLAEGAKNWDVGTWRLTQPDCFTAYFWCHESQETYNAGVPGKYGKPPLKPEFAAANDAIIEKLGMGQSHYDPNAECYPQGMPDAGHRHFVMSLASDRFILLQQGGSYQETRTIWMDGRDMPERELYEYSYHGDSIGHWEDNTLVIETRNITSDNTAISPNLPKSEDFWVEERWTFQDDTTIDVEMTFMDEQRFTEPYTESFQFIRDPERETRIQTVACVGGEGQRYFRDAGTGELMLTGPGGAPLQVAED